MCGIGVSSEIDTIFKPVLFSALIAEILPIPGPLTTTAISFIPAVTASCPASSAALVAAYGVDFRVPLNPALPELLAKRALPLLSVIVMIVLLIPAEIKAFPLGVITFSFFFFLVVAFFGSGFNRKLLAGPYVYSRLTLLLYAFRLRSDYIMH